MSLEFQNGPKIFCARDPEEDSALSDRREEGAGPERLPTKWSVQTNRGMNSDEWVLKSKHREWYYVRLQM